MKNVKNRVNSFDMFVRLDEQLSTTDDSSVKMIKAKLKSAAYNASSALSLMESNPNVTVDAYILAQIAVAADYLDHIEEYFRNFEGSGEDAGLPSGEETSDEPHTPAPEGTDEVAPPEAEPKSDDDKGGEDEPDETSDDETEDEIEDTPEEEQEEEE